MATLTAAGAASGASTAAATAAAGTAAASTATIGYTVGAGLSASAVAANVLTGLSVVSMLRQGQAAKIGSEVQADKIKQDAIRREVNRRKQLVSSLASQNATRAASGIAFFEGSSREIALEDIRTGQGSIASERTSADYAAESVLASGRYQRAGSVIGAGASLLNQINRNVDRG